MMIESAIQAELSANIVEIAVGSSGVSAADVASLHRHLFADGSLDRTEAEALFDLERAALSRCEAWTAFFVQAVTDHVVWGERPTGRLDEGQAEWLLAQVDMTRTPAAFAVLVNVIDEAQSLPSWFAGAVKARAVAGWPGVSRGEGAVSRPLRRAA
ncbi:hypothetical protein [Lichenibacterium ramalinae]|uniref:Uncharacterized protein n=1 Tax=Lichenibacterium ramalinae TaxID=2316527 RepID=A0A4Q2RBH6_9HYPH|nr:hypothetical protein [Lichenibacterium ramalinae]RYB04217.1 hypothetical protein D3272_14520 [Lichenibacterium ramalinae]